MTPATGATGYAVRDRVEWSRLQHLATIIPVILAPRHGDGAIACVVCGTVVWAVDPAPLFRACEPGLLRLAALTGLDLLEITLVDFEGSACVECVNPWAGLVAFDETAQQEIGARIARALTEPRGERLPAYEEAAS